MEAKDHGETLVKSQPKRPSCSTDVAVRKVSAPNAHLDAMGPDTCLKAVDGMSNGRGAKACPELRIAGMTLQPVAADLMAAHQAKVSKLFSRGRRQGELLRTVPGGQVTSLVTTMGDETSTGDCVLTVPSGEKIADENATGESCEGFTPEPTAAVFGPCGVNSAIASETTGMVRRRDSRQASAKSYVRRGRRLGAAGMVTWQDSRPTLVDSQYAREQGRTVSFRRADVGAGRVSPSPVDYAEKPRGGISGCDEESLPAESMTELGASTTLTRRKRSRSSRGEWPPNPNNFGQGSRKRRK